MKTEDWLKVANSEESKSIEEKTRKLDNNW